jgi:GMP reductase
MGELGVNEKKNKRSRKNKNKSEESVNYIQEVGAIDNQPDYELTFTTPFGDKLNSYKYMNNNVSDWLTIKPISPTVNMTDTKLDFDDIQLCGSPTPTGIRSRGEISEMVKDTNAYEDELVDYLPLMASPMDTLIATRFKESWNSHFQLELMEQGFRVCYPRGCNMAYYDNNFYSLSLSEFEAYLETYERLKIYANKRTFVLIDMANGHMQALVDAIKDSKTRFPDITLMVGNVGHPEMYAALSEVGADYVRVGIGNGAGCLTTQQTGIGYPMASLINECYQLSTYQKNPAKIVADGGFKKYADIVKAIALGADYVMLGSILNKAVESDSVPHAWGFIPMPNVQTAKMVMGWGVPLYKKFRGMSTKEVQKSWGNKELKTSEGVTRYQKVEYTLAGWTKNFASYLKSAMSYQNCTTLEEFRGSAKFIKISPNAHNRFKK